jgi:hypothetical protein
MNKVEKEAARKEAESLAAYQQFEQHKKTHDDMLKQFEAADKLCIACARELQPLLLAESPTADVLRMKLHGLRAQRDGISYSWNRTRDLLTYKVEKFTMPELSSFGAWVLEMVRLLGNRISTTFKDSQRSYDLEHRRIECMSNLEAVKNAQNRLFAGLKRAQTFRIKPLIELHEVINQAVFQYRDDVEDLEMKPITLTEQGYRELQSVSADLQQGDGMTVYRRGNSIEYGTPGRVRTQL